MTSASTALDGILDELEQEHAELDRLVAGLDEAGWDLPTPAEGWQVRDQISHLAFFDDTATMALTDPPGFAAAAEAALARAGDPMQEHLDRGRDMPGKDVLSWWRGARKVMVGAARSADPAARVPWFGPPMSLMSFVTARLMETWAHGLDVADTFGVAPVPSARLRHVAYLGVRARDYSYLVRGLEVPAGTVLVELTAPDGDRWSWGEDGGEPADSVRGPALDFCLVVTQRRHLADTALVVEGPLATEWMGIAQAFAGGPGPGRPPRPA